jgi:hypothetical protein
LHDLELQRADGGEQRRFHRRIAQVKRLDDALLHQLLQALAELLELGRVRIVQVAEGFRREARDFLVEIFGSVVSVSPMPKLSWPTRPMTSPGYASSTVSRSLPNSLCELERRTFFAERE